MKFLFILICVLSTLESATREFDKNVLVCDGGGLKGIYIASILEQIESDLLVQRELHHTYQFFKGGITGTSTGSIIALALVCPNQKTTSREPISSGHPYSAKEIKEFYEKMGYSIFSDGVFCDQFEGCKLKSSEFKCCSMTYKCNRCEENWEETFCCNDGLCSNIVECVCAKFFCCTPQPEKFGQVKERDITCSEGLCNFIKGISTCCFCCGINKNCGSLCGPKYSNRTLKYYLQAFFGDTTLEEALGPVQIVTYDYENDKPIYITKEKYPKMKMWEAALASSAAPTFFPVASVLSGNKTDKGHDQMLHCVDGGVFDNSSGIAGLSYSKKLHSVRIDDHMIVVIGTGERDILRTISPSTKRPCCCSILRSIIDIALDGATKAKNSSLEEIFEPNEVAGKVQQYFRIQFNTKDALPMDDPSKLQTFLGYATQSIVRNAEGSVQQPPYIHFFDLYITPQDTNGMPVLGPPTQVMK
jgi:hypothetical protein